ncbi:MAG TPA: DUF2892 domain-containing protein [Steroidobacteraceae bacterium]|nr:DUF2892 domain-containing protein [Steroidobacteraceae bacterium]
MSVERVVVAFSGIGILLSLVLAYFVHPNWLALAAIIGLNLSQSAFTGFCPFEYVLKKVGMDPDTALSNR